jgi:predicted nucleic-acid-binding Zn-ribbon protein
MNIELTVVCQNCGYKSRKGGSQVDDRISISCRNCGVNMVLDAARLRTHLLNLERAVKECRIFEFSVTIK